MTDENRSYFILGIQISLSSLVYTLLAVWYAAPYLGGLALSSALTMVLIPHAMRHVGMTVLSGSVVDKNIPNEVSYPIGYGDLAAAVAALVALIALRMQSGIAVPLVWTSTLIGVADLVNAGIVAARKMKPSYKVGSFWYIPTFVVPFLFVTHGLTLWLLLK